MDLFSIIHGVTLAIEGDYCRTKTCIQEKLREWISLYSFDDVRKQVNFKTEGPLIPEGNSRVPILILLSNPHPHSVEQGMFLSPNRIGRKNPFWDTLRNSGYFDPRGSITPQLMIQNIYKSPFRLFMAVFFPFPTEDPTHLVEFFGSVEYKRMIQSGKGALKKLIDDQGIFNVICFGQTQYDIISKHGTNHYIAFLKDGGIIQDKIWFSEKVDVYLTYPTGWRFAKNASKLKSDNLRSVFKEILDKAKEGN